MTGFYLICGVMIAFASFIGVADFLQRREERRKHQRAK